jgi:hypothetical protein
LDAAAQVERARAALCFRRASATASALRDSRYFRFGARLGGAVQESIYSEEESGSEAAEDEWRAQGVGGGRGGGCFGGDFGDDAATLARAAQWRRENPDLAVRQAEFFHSLWDDPGGAVAKEELLGARALAGLQA